MTFRRKIVLILVVLVVTIILDQSLPALAQKVWPSPQQRYNSTRDELVSLLNQQNPTVAMEALAEKMQKDPQVSESCHALVHELGHAAFVKYGSFDKAMQFQNDICGSGYLHGVIESTFQNSSDMLSLMDTICKGNPSKNFTQKCYHGVGHGLMYFTENDLPRSLDLCSTYRDNDTKLACSEGIFMENFSTDMMMHQSAYLHADDIFQTCREQNTFYKGSCYFYAPIYYLTLHPDDFSGAFSWCDSAESAFETRCLNGVGSRAMKQYVYDPKKAETICLKDSPNLRACVDGLVSYYLVETQSVAAAEKMCNDFQSSTKNTCLDSVDFRKEIYLGN